METQTELVGERLHAAALVLAERENLSYRDALERAQRLRAERRGEAFNPVVFSGVDPETVEAALENARRTGGSGLDRLTQSDPWTD